MTTIRKAGWVAMVVLASLIAMYAAVILVVPASNAPFLATRRAAMSLAVYAHLAGGLWALAGQSHRGRPLRDRVSGHCLAVLDAESDRG
jgi:hypothetical protein